jgi:hypothetical protein
MKFKIINLILLILANVSSFGQIPTNSLVGHWRFNGNANDESTFNNDGTLINGASFTFDRFNNSNKALKLVNSNQQYVDVPNNSSLQIDSSITISFWAKRTTYGSGVIDQVLNKGGDWIGGTCNYGLVFSDNSLIFIHNNGYHGIAVPGIPANLLLPYNGPYGTTLPGAPQDTLWHHYVITTYNNSPIAYFYVDSILVPTFWDGYGQNIVLNPNSTSNLYIGGVHYYSNNIMDDIRIYRTMVSQNEVTALYNETCNSYSSFSTSSCFSYTAPDGIIYTSSGIVTAIIPNSGGCDSTITINLTINTVDTSVILTGNTLTANAANSAYKWLNCDNGFSVIPGETNQSFTPAQSGSYAVQIIQNQCIDTSACYLVTITEISETNFGDEITIYPNPTGGVLKINLGTNLTDCRINISDITGRQIIDSFYNSTEMIEVDINAQPGLYILTVVSQGKTAIMRIIKY